MSDRTNGPEFPKHFDGRHFYNPDAPQARGLLDVIQWKLTSRPEPSPSFIADVEQSAPPPRVNGNGLRVTLVNSFDGPASARRLQHSDRPHLVGTSKSSRMDRSPAPEKAWSANGRSAAHRRGAHQPQPL